ncbi:MAG: 4Fe-4S binding protein [Longimicrobiales bacterium]|nr:4Fe-4S binding protein [Longimicrobiales bacterium]
MLLVASAVTVSGQRVRGVRESLVRTVMPGADRFSEVAGDPPVLTGYHSTSEATEVVHGYVFLTSDLPPEQFGYSGPIEALVGILPDGTLTGMRVIDYQESYMSSMGDFLRTPGFQEQYAGKHIGDPFQLWGDIEGISRVSISVRALSRGVRDSARRVAAAYGGVPDLSTESGIVDPVGLSWFELRQRGFVERFVVTEPGEGTAGISLAHISNDRLGEYYFGPQLYERALRSAERRGGGENLLLYAVDGSRLRLFRQQGWTVEQEGEVTEVDSRNVVSMGLPSGGIVSGEATMVGIMLVDGAVDMSRPFTLIYDLGDLGTHNIEYVSQEARLLAAEEASLAAAEERASADRASETPGPDEVEVAEEATAEVAEEATGEVAADAEVLDSVPGAAAGETGAADGEIGDGEAAAVIPARNLNDAQAADLDFVLTEDETLLERTLAGTSWPRVALMLLVLALGTVAFATKIPSLRWVALTVTLFGLGFGDGGFLSVSHITSGIWAGVGVYLRDIPLLLIVAFTLITTLVWGRVFCGFLCPFGALQDFIDRFVPKSLKRPLTQAIHDKAVYAKYVVLAVIVLPALAGSRVSLYQYFEPFGTVFFRSSDVLLWTIAAVFLAASVVIPRFYCRYACPLGAALGVLSLLSLKRIERVEQCGHCKICEQKCPTGAIRGPDIDFHECVRCNVCEVQLIQKAGVCRHDMNVIRPRLIQLTAESAPEAVDD